MVEDLYNTDVRSILMVLWRGFPRYLEMTPDAVIEEGDDVGAYLEMAAVSKQQQTNKHLTNEQLVLQSHPLQVFW